MAKMGTYCKAYPVSEFRGFGSWSENVANLRKDEAEADGKQVEIPRDLTDDDHLYLQEDYGVTDGIFMDEHIIFNNVTPEWIDFCRNVLKFEVPSYDEVDAA